MTAKIKKLHSKNEMQLFWWERMDSNHRSEDATDLQSAPIGHSGTLPYSINGAGGRTRTPDLLITNQLLYQLSYTSLYCLICRTDDIYYIISPSTCQALFILFSFFLIKWSRRQDLNLRHLGPKPSTLPN